MRAAILCCPICGRIKETCGGVGLYALMLACFMLNQPPSVTYSAKTDAVTLGCKDQAWPFQVSRTHSIKSSGAPAGHIELALSFFDVNEEPFWLMDDLCTGQYIWEERQCTFSYNVTTCHHGPMSGNLIEETTAGHSTARTSLSQEQKRNETILTQQQIIEHRLYRSSACKRERRKCKGLAPAHK